MTVSLEWGRRNSFFPGAGFGSGSPAGDGAAARAREREPDALIRVGRRSRQPDRGSCWRTGVLGWLGSRMRFGSEGEDECFPELDEELRSSGVVPRRFAGLNGRERRFEIG